MGLILVGTSAIGAEREFARKALLELYYRCIENDKKHDLLVILGNHDTVTIDKDKDKIVLQEHCGSDFSTCRFQIIDFMSSSPIECMDRWGRKFTSHVIGYAYEREE